MNIPATILTLTLFCSCNSNKIPEQPHKALLNSDKFILLSLDPEGKDDNNNFQGWKILGKMTLEGKDREAIIEAFEDGVSENSDTVALCFIPRHGIEVTHENVTYRLVICFQCLQAVCFYDGTNEKFLTSNSPRELFNSVLKKAKIPLAK